jgi:UDP-2-acetamido-3-amino-2,3-dideoxy-glucuronate N-acetyltransferase
MAGVPAKRIGWVSRTGEVLKGDMVYPRTGEKYEVVEGQLRPREFAP